MTRVKTRRPGQAAEEAEKTSNFREAERGRGERGSGGGGRLRGRAHSILSLVLRMPGLILDTNRRGALFCCFLLLRPLLLLLLLQIPEKEEKTFDREPHLPFDHASAASRLNID